MRWATCVAVLLALVVALVLRATSDRAGRVDGPERQTTSGVRAEPLVEPPTDAPARTPKPVTEEPAAASHRPARRGRVPREYLESGRERLVLSCRDVATDEPVVGHVEVWRLDVPEDEAWTAGDRLRIRLEVPEAGVVLTQLPRGRYRVHVLNGRAGTTSPPPFTIPETEELVLRLELPDSRGVRLELVDETGHRLLGVEVERPRLAYTKDFEPPAWARVREARDPDAWTRSNSASGSHELQATVEGQTDDHVLVQVPGASTWESERLVSFRLRATGVPWTTVFFDAALVEAGHTEFVGVALGEDVYEAWRRQLGGDPTFKVHCTVVPHDTATAWRDAPLYVCVWGSGVDRRDRTFTLAEGLPDL